MVACVYPGHHQPIHNVIPTTGPV